MAAPETVHLGLYTREGLRGYASFTPVERALLEIFVAPSARSEAVPFLTEALARFAPASWEVSSYDRFGLSLAWNAGYTPAEFTAYLFSFGGGAGVPDLPGFVCQPAQLDDIPEIVPILAEDKFYTADWDRLPDEIGQGLWHVLRSPAGHITGTGYWQPIARSPRYADVGMVVTAAWRRRGLGALLLTEMATRCTQAALTPVAVCGAENEPSRRTLARAGFYADGRIWGVRL